MSARQSGRRGSRRDGGQTAAALARRGPAEFLSSFAALKEAIRLACAPHVRWEARVVAAIQATLRFAAAEPAMAHALIVHGRRERDGEGGGDRERELVAHFATALAAVAPAGSRHSISTDEGVIEAIAAVIRGHLQAGAPERLPAVAPDLVYLALMPYVGLDEARRWAESADIPASEVRNSSV